jgi:hypothetical protein
MRQTVTSHPVARSRLHTSVDDEATVLAALGALGQGTLGFHFSPARAGLRGEEPPVGYDEEAAVPDELVVNWRPSSAGEVSKTARLKPALARAPFRAPFRA